MGETSIEWVRNEDGTPGQSWPIVNGCLRISPGCGGARGVGGCYAERLISTRLSKTKKYGGLAVFGKNGPKWTGESRLWLPDLAMPLKLRKPSHIFVADMGDLFFEPVTNEEIAAIYGVMSVCRKHIFKVLTKRAERLPVWYVWAAAAAQEKGVSIVRLCREYAEALLRSIDDDGPRGNDDGNRLAILGHAVDEAWPLPNVWVGVSAENQKYADERIPELLRIPAPIHFVSLEPLLDLVRLREDWLVGRFLECPDETADEKTDECLGCTGVPGDGDHCGAVRGPHLDWVIVGGESGPGARPFAFEWAGKILEQCRRAGVAFFMKQGGTAPTWDGELVQLRTKKGGDPKEWPAGLDVRDYPRVAGGSP